MRYVWQMSFAVMMTRVDLPWFSGFEIACVSFGNVGLNSTDWIIKLVVTCVDLFALSQSQTQTQTYQCDFSFCLHGKWEMLDWNLLINLRTLCNLDILLSCLKICYGHLLLFYSSNVTVWVICSSYAAQILITDFWKYNGELIVYTRKKNYYMG